MYIQIIIFILTILIFFIYIIIKFNSFIEIQENNKEETFKKIKMKEIYNKLNNKQIKQIEIEDICNLDILDEEIEKLEKDYIKEENRKTQLELEIKELNEIIKSNEKELEKLDKKYNDLNSQINMITTVFLTYGN